MARTVHVNLGERSYDIHIGTHPVAGGLPAADGGKALLVSDSHVAPLFGDRFEKLLNGRGLEARRAVVPAGETSKTLEQAVKLYTVAAEARLDRRSVIVALGGGMIGDLAGFVAGTYLRGVRLVQIPTTLLAMVDSSIGGKTAVNLPQGKNLVGVFHQPCAVVADLATLESLPPREYVSGLAEVVKYGVIWDAALFRNLEVQADALLRRDPAVLEDTVARCCEIKAEIVALDERETGVRATLNFGHTLGHALEQAGGFSRWLHGEAVALGMVYAGRLSAARTFPAADADRLTGLLARLGLPVRLDTADARLWPALRAAMASDKKTLGDRPRFVLAERLGGVVFGCEVEEECLESAFRTLSS